MARKKLTSEGLSSSVSVVDIFSCLILSAFLDQALFLKECYAVLQNRIVPEWERVFSCFYLLQCLIALFIHGGFTLRTLEFKNGDKPFSWVLQHHICSACSGFTIGFDYDAFHAGKQSCKESMIENFMVIIWKLRELIIVIYMII